MTARRVHLNRALSKRGVLSRSQATRAILDGQVSVNGRIVRDPAAAVNLESARIEVAGQAAAQGEWRTILVHKPRGVVTTSRDPEGRPTIYDAVGEAAQGLVPVGRLDLATSGLLLLTTDTKLADWITDPVNRIARVYIVTVRGRVTPEDCQRLENGLSDGRDVLQAASVQLRKVSARESHLTVELREGKNREVRRLFDAIGHEVLRLKRVKFGALELGHIAPGGWRQVSTAEIRTAFPSADRLESRQAVSPRAARAAAIKRRKV